jgi:hypothetical protein
VQKSTTGYSAFLAGSPSATVAGIQNWQVKVVVLPPAGSQQTLTYAGNSSTAGVKPW